MKKLQLNAVKLRLILSISLFAITAIGVGLFVFASSMLSNFAGEVSRKTADANASQNNLQTLQQIERELADKQDVVERAGKIVADSQNYQYQNQIINDLNRHAARSGISLTNIDFATGGQTSQGGQTAPTAPSAPAGLTAATISITIKNPVSYPNLLRFLRAIELNLTKMQVAKISLSKSETGISSDILSITLYVK